MVLCVIYVCIYTLGHEVEGLVDTTERRDINSLTLDLASVADTGRVFAGRGVHDSVDEDLDGVGTSHEVDDLERVLDDAEGHELLAVVAAVHHEAVDETLNNGALSLAEALLVVSPGGVGDVDFVLGLLVDRDVVDERHVSDVDCLVVPLVEKLGGHPQILRVLSSTKG